MTKYTPRPAILISCGICGTKFSARHPKRKYCSDKCREAAVRAKQPDYLRHYRERHPDKVSESQRAYRASHLEETRERTRNFMRQWREENPEESRARAKDYYQRNAEERRAYQQKYRQENGDRVAAQSAVNDAVRAGNLPHVKTLTCVRCGDPATEYHHWSYEEENWLDVEAMCPTCHARADQERIKAETQ